MNTLNQTEMAKITGGDSGGDIEWTYDLLMLQLQKQAEEAERKFWQEYMASQSA